jgi:hypothetical protein
MPKQARHPASDSDGRHIESAIDRRVLPSSALRWRCDPAQLVFETTNELSPLEKLVGQDRAERAISLSVVYLGIWGLIGAAWWKLIGIW